MVDRFMRGFARCRASVGLGTLFFTSEISEDVYLMDSRAGRVILVSSESEGVRYWLVETGAAEDSGLSSGKTRLSARYIAFPVLIVACDIWMN